MNRCCGPALNPTPAIYQGAYRILGHVYVPVGLHKGSHQQWICLENVETGERKDLWTTLLDMDLTTGAIATVEPMEVVAIASKTAPE
jgi:hypothetical protein